MKPYFADTGNMPLNNNQKVQSAADRLAKLPMLRAAYVKLSVLYTSTKCSHPSLKRLCEVLENSVTVLSTMVTARLSPAIVKLEPHISVANDVACKSLDWLESAFPVLLTPTEEVVASAKNRMFAVQEVVSTATKGTLGMVEHVVGRVLQVDDQLKHSLVERTIIMGSWSLDCALNMSEALIDRMLPPTENKKDEDPRLVEGFEAKSLDYSTRMTSLTSELYRRIYEKVLETFPRSSDVSLNVRAGWCTVVTTFWMVPQYLQHRAASLFFYILHMYRLNAPQKNNSQVEHLVSAFEESLTQTEVSKVDPQDNPDQTVRSRLTHTSMMKRDKQGCNVKGCGNR